MLQDRTEYERIGVSVIIPVYNKKEYLEKCIESVLDSSFDSVEIICIDDCSTDGSGEILEKIKQKSRNIKVIKNSENMGVSYSRNAGIDIAKGKYIVFLDADDYLDQYALEKYYYALDEVKAEGCFIKLITSDGMYNITNSYDGVYSGKELLSELVANDEMFLYACGSIWATDYIRNNNIRFKNLKIGEGGLYTLEALINADSVIVSDYPGYHYYINESSTINRKESMQLSAIGQLHQIAFMILQLRIGADDEAIVAFLRWYLRKSMGGINNLKVDYLNSNIIPEASNIKFLAELVKGQYLEKKIALSKKDEKVIKEKGCVYLYGAGYETLDVIKLCNRLNVEIMGIYVSDKNGNPPNIYGFRVNVFSTEAITDLSVPFLVSAHKKHHKAIKKVLVDSGIKNIIMVGD